MTIGVAVAVVCLSIPLYIMDPGAIRLLPEIDAAGDQSLRWRPRSHSILLHLQLSHPLPKTKRPWRMTGSLRGAEGPIAIAVEGPHLLSSTDGKPSSLYQVECRLPPNLDPNQLMLELHLQVSERPVISGVGVVDVAGQRWRVMAPPPAAAKPADNTQR